jgi:U-box domain
MSLEVEQGPTMSTSIAKLEGVGEVTTRVFNIAGYNTVGDLHKLNADDRKLREAAEQVRLEGEFPASYTKSMMVRCVNIIYRARNAEAAPYIPAHFICPISLDWLVNPVVTPSGITYSKKELEMWVSDKVTDPIARSNLEMSDVVPNLVIAAAVHYHRSHHAIFNIMG